MSDLSLQSLNVLFDLDGTLLDPFEGIAGCIEHALRELAVACPPRAELMQFIGPPLRNSFAQLLGAKRAPDVERAVELYRERFVPTGMFENTLYPGIPAALQELRTRGATLFVATSKPAVYAEPILTHFGLREHFVAVYGSELDGRRSAKQEVLGWLLKQQALDARTCVMVGDRQHDVNGAADHGIPCVGVLWGYGSEAELMLAGAPSLCDAPARLPERIARLARTMSHGVAR